MTAEDRGVIVSDTRAEEGMEQAAEPVCLRARETAHYPSREAVSADSEAKGPKP